MMVCPYYEIASGFEKGSPKMICVGCRSDSQSCKQNRWLQYINFRARGHFRTFGPTYDLDIFRLADPRCISCFKNTDTKRQRRPEPARSGCVLGLGRDVFFGGRLREGSVLGRFCSEGITKETEFDQRSRIESRRHPQK